MKTLQNSSGDINAAFRRSCGRGDIVEIRRALVLKFLS